MFGFGKNSKTPKADSDQAIEKEPVGLFARLKQGLAKTRGSFGGAIANLVVGKKTIDDELLEEIETQLLLADVGIDATSQIISDLTDRLARKQLSDSDALLSALRDDLAAMLEPSNIPLSIPDSDSPFVILVVGVNGVGKTTSIGKLAKQLQADGRSVMLAAGDTFRAAAVEQLEVWGERNDIAVVAQHTGADAASVIFDALKSAQAKKIDVLIADTAGRLHNKDNLMEELAKIKRVLGKLDVAAPHEVLIVLDATTGQNALAQTEQFNKIIGLTGVALTKLDGTAKGGIIFSIANKTGLPIRFIGVGEGIDDLRAFNAKDFIEALF